MSPNIRNSLALKLTAGFVLVGIIGAILVALISWRQTREAFDRFVTVVDADAVAGELSDNYVESDGWAFIDPDFRLPAQYRRSRLAILDSENRILYGFAGNRTGEVFEQRDKFDSTPITVDAVTVGTLVVQGNEGFNVFSARPNPEIRFLQNISRASVLSAIVASSIALVLGIMLSRTLMRPIRELTDATQTIAGGNFGEQVEVRSRDEIGRLATAFNKMSTDLAAASQSRKQMTADIAHDLRTPLSVLRGYTEGLKDGVITGDRALFGVMFEEVEHLEHLVTDLRTLSLADAGELTLNRRAVDPKALLERTGLKYVMQAEQKGIDLRIEAADRLPSISVDLERMTQVLNNLVSNAINYTTSGEIVLAAQINQATKQSVLQVKDTGSGIASNDLPHIFERFYRADKSRQRQGSSSGLGLAIAKAIVTAHGGTIDVQSQPQQGTIFSISLS